MENSTANDSSHAGSPAAVPSFEAAMSQLQTIVAELEDGTLGLEESLAHYEQGTGLLRRCYQILNSAEQKIELLTRIDADGNIETEPFDASATLDQREATAGRRESTRKTSRATAARPSAEKPAPAEKTKGKLFAADDE